MNLEKRKMLVNEGLQFKREPSNLLLHRKSSLDTLNTLVFLSLLCIGLLNKKIKCSCNFVSNRASYVTGSQ